MKLEVLDNLEPEPPKELQGTFDIVHLQLWLGGVPNGDPIALLTHALKLLHTTVSLATEENHEATDKSI